MSTHTPGPWFVSLNPYRVAQRGPLGVFRLVAEAFPGYGATQEGHAHMSLPPEASILASEAQANARLIALAPELLKIAQDAADALGVEAMQQVQYAARGLLKRIERPA